MLTEKEILYCINKRKIEEARSNILRGNDIESACLIIKEALYNSVIMVDDEINITKIAIRQALDFIEEYKNKGYLDVVREKVQLKEKNNKQAKMINEMVESLCRLYEKHPGVMHKFFENGKPCEYAYDKENNECKEINCRNCIKQYFENKAGVEYD